MFDNVVLSRFEWTTPNFASDAIAICLAGVYSKIVAPSNPGRRLQASSKVPSADEGGGIHWTYVVVIAMVCALGGAAVARRLL